MLGRAGGGDGGLVLVQNVFGPAVRGTSTE